VRKKASGNDPALFEVEPAVPKKRRSPKPGADHGIQRCIGLYHDTFLARFGFKPQIHGAKDGAHIKSLIAAWGETDVVVLIVEFLTTTDPRIVRSDYTLGAFYNLAQYLRLRHTRTDERTANNVDAAMRATAPAHDPRRSR